MTDLLEQIEAQKQKIKKHDEAMNNWPSGKSTVDRNIARFYMVKRLENLQEQHMCDGD